MRLRKGIVRRSVRVLPDLLNEDAAHGRSLEGVQYVNTFDATFDVLQVS